MTARDTAARMEEEDAARRRRESRIRQQLIESEAKDLRREAVSVHVTSPYSPHPTTLAL